MLTLDCDFYVWHTCMWLLFILCTGLLCVLRVVSPCCRHKPFGVTAILVRMPLMSVISIFLCMALLACYISTYWPAPAVVGIVLDYWWEHGFFGCGENFAHDDVNVQWRQFYRQHRA